MNPYKKLLKNTSIFAIANLGSKIISILLVPLYTYVLSTNEYGTIDMVSTSISLILPIITLSICDATLRFSVSSNYEEKSILSSSFIIVIMGNLFFLTIYPFLRNIENFKNVINFLYIILVLQSLNSLLSQFSRGIGKVKQFAFNGLIITIVTIFFNIILLVKFNMGIKGYFTSIIIANIISIIYLSISLRIWKYLSIKKIRLSLIKEMLYYSLPLIPNSLMWWIMNASDRYAIILFLGVSYNGIYAVANKIPTLLNTLYSIFSQAWQLSAIEEANNENKTTFYTNTFSILSTIMLLGSSFIIMFIKFFVKIALDSSYQNAWKYAPFLILALVFTTFSSFLGTNYIAMKKTRGVFKTSLMGAIANILLNIVLIPKIGLNGAAISTMISFLLVWIIRIYDTREFVNIDFNFNKILFSLIFIFIQIAVLYSSIKYYIIIELLLFFLILILNKKEIFIIISKAYETLNKKSKI